MKVDDAEQRSRTNTQYQGEDQAKRQKLPSQVKLSRQIESNRVLDVIERENYVRNSKSQEYQTQSHRDLHKKGQLNLFNQNHEASQAKDLLLPLNRVTNVIDKLQPLSTTYKRGRSSKSNGSQEQRSLRGREKLGQQVQSFFGQRDEPKDRHHTEQQEEFYQQDKQYNETGAPDEQNEVNMKDLLLQSKSSVQEKSSLLISKGSRISDERTLLNMLNHQNLNPNEVSNI